MFRFLIRFLREGERAARPEPSLKGLPSVAPPGPRSRVTGEGESEVGQHPIRIRHLERVEQLAHVRDHARRVVREFPRFGIG